MVLEVRNLRFSYGLRFVLDGVEMTLNNGEIFGLLGPNGCGKTTLLKCINRILRPTGGVVLIEGKDTTKMNEIELAKKISYVPQSHNPVFPYTVLDFVLFGRTPYIGVFSNPKESDYEVAMRALKTVGMESFAERPYSELSGGQRQLVLIARALASEAKILLLDEPTAHLDFERTHRVLSILRRIIKKENLSAIMTLHDPNLAIKYCDKIAVIHEGKVFRYGTPEIVDPELIRIVYGIESMVLKFDGLKVIIPKED